MNARCDQIDFITIIVKPCPYPNEIFTSRCIECEQYINCRMCVNCCGYWNIANTPKEAFIMFYTEGENI